MLRINTENAAADSVTVNITKSNYMPSHLNAVAYVKVTFADNSFSLMKLYLKYSVY